MCENTQGNDSSKHCWKLRPVEDKANNRNAEQGEGRKVGSCAPDAHKDVLFKDRYLNPASSVRRLLR